MPSSRALSRDSSSASLQSLNRSQQMALPTRQLSSAFLFARLGIPVEDASETTHHTKEGMSAPLEFSSAPSSPSTTSPTLHMIPIEADILLPFADRPTEVEELLVQHTKNKSLYDLLKEIFTVKSSHVPFREDLSPKIKKLPNAHSSIASLPSTSSLHTAEDPSRRSSGSTLRPQSPGVGEKWVWEDVQNHLATPRQAMPDQEWIDTLKRHVSPRSQLLWERLRACLGVDVDDERGCDRYEPLSSDIVIQPEPDGITRPILDTTPRTVSQGSIKSPVIMARPCANPSMNSDSEGSVSKSPARNHRRTSSSSSSFRRSFAMSSIHEERPLEIEKSEDEAIELDMDIKGPYPFPEMSPSDHSPAQETTRMATASEGVELGSLLRLKGYSIDQTMPTLAGSTDNSPSSPSTALGNPHIPGRTYALPRLPSTSSFSHPSTMYSSLGLHFGHSGTMGDGPPFASTAIPSANPPLSLRQGQGYIDDLDASGSEDSQSISGSRARGPGVSASRKSTLC